MGKLHELLAVDQELASQAKKLLDEAKNTFTKKLPHFLGYIKTLNMFDDSRKNEEQAGREVKEVVTTVDEKLSFLEKFMIKHYDALAQKEATNQTAISYVDINGVDFLTNIPATLLLALESKLAQLRDLYADIPTLEPGVKWEEDLQASRVGMYKAVEKQVKNKTENVLMHKIIVPATDKHPAQVEKWNKDAPIGVYTTENWSGCLSPKEKAERLARIDELIQAIKQARQRANCVEVLHREVGKKIFDFINKGIL